MSACEPVPTERSDLRQSRSAYSRSRVSEDRDSSTSVRLDLICPTPNWDKSDRRQACRPFLGSVLQSSRSPRRRCQRQLWLDPAGATDRRPWRRLKHSATIACASAKTALSFGIQVLYFSWSVPPQVPDSCLEFRASLHLFRAFVFLPKMSARPRSRVRREPHPNQCGFDQALRPDLSHDDGPAPLVREILERQPR